MKLFSYPVDVFTCALLILTVVAVIALAVNKRFTKSQKYLALAVTFFITGSLGLIALYSLPVCVGVCLLITVVCSALYSAAGREEQRETLLPIQTDHQLNEGRESTAYLLPDSDPRPLPGVRLINGRSS